MRQVLQLQPGNDHGADGCRGSDKPLRRVPHGLLRALKLSAASSIRMPRLVGSGLLSGPDGRRAATLTTSVRSDHLRP